LLRERWELIDPLNIQHVLDVSERNFHSLSTLLSTLLVEDARNPYTIEIKRNIADIGIPALNLILNIVRGVFILFSIYFIRSVPFKRPVSKLQSYYEVSYILLIIPLIFPHQQHYAFFFVFPAIVYLIYYTLRKYFEASLNSSVMEKRMFISLLIIIYLLLNSHLLLGEFEYFYNHFKTLTYGVILIIPLLAYARPESLPTIKERINYSLNDNPAPK
jgi:hypothetical protein